MGLGRIRVAAQHFVRSDARVVLVGWAALSISAFALVLRYGQNIPAWEEWYYLPVFFGDSPRVPWLFERLHEHRYILGRAVFLVGFDLSGGDFRAGMFLSAGLLSAAGWVLARAAAEAQGRADGADLLLPALMLNLAGYENLLLGYQVQFTLNVLLAAVFLRLAVNFEPGKPLGTATKAGALTVPLALGGWAGFRPATDDLGRVVGLVRQGWGASPSPTCGSRAAGRVVGRLRGAIHRGVRASDAGTGAERPRDDHPSGRGVPGDDVRWTVSRLARGGGRVCGRGVRGFGRLPRLARRLPKESLRMRRPRRRAESNRS